jgi:hypothetical protein
MKLMAGLNNYKYIINRKEVSHSEKREKASFDK